MKLLASFFCILMTVSFLTGCKSNKEEKEAYFNDGQMDEQVEQWKKPGGRY